MNIRNVFRSPLMWVALAVTVMLLGSNALSSISGPKKVDTWQLVADITEGRAKAVVLATGGAGRVYPQNTNAGIVTGQAAATQMSLNFSRDMEREADRVGFNVLVEAGFAGSGMVSMFERMDQAYHLMDNWSFPYLRSHPLTSERIGDARTRLALEPFARPRGLAEHALMAARARVLMDPRVEAWKVLENYDAGARNLKDGNGYEQLGARYAAALSSIKLRNFDRARPVFVSRAPASRIRRSRTSSGRVAAPRAS